MPKKEKVWPLSLKEEAKENLTFADIQVVDLMLQGVTKNEDIAEKLGISLSAVKARIARLGGHLGLEDREKTTILGKFYNDNMLDKK